MRNTLRKLLSLFMVALLLVTSVPGLTFAGKEEKSKLELKLLSIVRNTATFKLDYAIADSTYEGNLNDSNDWFIINPDNNIFSIKNLDFNKNYNLVVHQFNQGEKTTATIKFKTQPKPKPELTLVVSGGGYVKLGRDYTFKEGSHPLGTDIENYTGKAYSYAGFSGGMDISYNFSGQKDETWYVSFKPELKVHEMPYYETNGFFSGNRGWNDDINKDHDPKGDVLSANMTSNNHPIPYDLNSIVPIELTVDVLSGDVKNNKDTDTLHEVDFYSNGVKLGSYNEVKDGLYSFNLLVPKNEAELLLDNYVYIETIDHVKYYSKQLNFELVDRYDGDDAAAILATAQSINHYSKSSSAFFHS